MTWPPWTGGEGRSDARSSPDPEGFVAIYDLHHADIHAYLAGRLGGQVADDLAAEVFLIAFRKRRRFDPARGHVRVWLFGIATNLVARHRRAEARRLRALEHATDPVGAAEDDGERIAERVTAQALRPRLARALRALSDGDRDVLLLAALGGLAYGEIGEALGIPQGTVGSRLNRARRQLRQILGPDHPVPGPVNQMEGTHSG